MDYKSIVEWDIATWKRALLFWQQSIEIRNQNMGVGIELGGRHGGISYFFASQFGANVICSDVGPASETAQNLHQGKQVAHLISYADVNAANIPYPDNHFDFVVFKSILGVVGARGRTDQIEQAIAEIHRVLKPGGILLFAENLKGSLLHQWSRRLFVPWGKAWYYLDLHEMNGYLADFQQKELHTTGFLAAFIPKPTWLKNIAASIDSWLFFLPDSWNYVVYGYAVK